MRGSLPWGNPQVVEVEILEQSVRNIFTSRDGEILWEYLQRTILNTVIVGGDMSNNLEYMNGKRALVLHLKSLATRGQEQ